MKKHKILNWALGLGILLPSLAAAASTPQVLISNVAGIQKILCAIFDYMFWFLIAIASIMILVAAFYYVTAGDNAEKVSKATKTITYAAIAVVVALLATQIPIIIGNFFGANNVSSNSCGSIASVTSTFTPN